MKRRTRTIYRQCMQGGFVILAAKNAMAGRKRRRTDANGFERFSLNCKQKAHLTGVYEAAANRIDVLRT